jgi:Uri superfamily endonuclease
MLPTDIPAAKGTYALIFRTAASLRFAAGALGEVELPAGVYVYVGSAHGPGGLRARVGWHLRADKPRRWHVDALTALAAPVDVVWEDGAEPLECVWVRRLLALPGAYAPMRGFGSSDCAHGCPAHLVCVPAEIERLEEVL